MRRRKASCINHKVYRGGSVIDSDVYSLRKVVRTPGYTGHVAPGDSSGKMSMSFRLWKISCRFRDDQSWRVLTVMPTLHWPATNSGAVEVFDVDVNMAFDLYGVLALCNGLLYKDCTFDGIPSLISVAG